MANDKCSIIVCTYNRLQYLKKCVASLLEINFPEYEIIIVNDGSTDGTNIYLDSLSDKRIKVIHNENNIGLSKARNVGIENATYEIVAFTDDDCTVDKNWLTELLSGFLNEQIGFVIGQVYYINKGYKGYFPERLVSNPRAQWPMGCNIAYNKSVFNTCGNFDHSFFKYNNEDSEMAIRTISKGFTFARSLKAVVNHQAIDWTVNSLLASARNASVWPVLKKKYKTHYLYFGPPIRWGMFVNIEDYLYMLILPLFIPLLFVRYLMHGKNNILIFFTKWPICLFLKRYYILKEAMRNGVYMF